MNCLIIDGNKDSSRTLERIIKRSVHLELVANCASATQAEAVLLKHEIDIVFMDELMQSSNAMSFLNYLESKKPHLVLVRSKKENKKPVGGVPDADFLTKPVSNSKFRKTVNKIILSESNIPVNTDFIFIKHDRGLRKIMTCDVLYIQALSNYVRIYTSDNIYTSYLTMKEALSRLPEKDFIQVHRSYIARVDRISQFQEGFLHVDQKLIPIGKSFKKQLVQRLTIL